jgi:hypothetical protein
MNAVVPIRIVISRIEVIVHFDISPLPLSVSLSVSLSLLAFLLASFAPDERLCLYSINHRRNMKVIERFYRQRERNIDALVGREKARQTSDQPSNIAQMR